MAVSPPTPITLETKPEISEPENPTVQLPQPNPPSSSESTALADSSNPAIAAAAPPLLPPHPVLSGAPPLTVPSFRPVSTPPQFPPAPNPNPNGHFQGVSITLPAPASVGAGSAVPVRGVFVPHGVPPDPALFRVTMNGFPPQGTVRPPGIHMYPMPYAGMVRGLFAPRPPGAIGVAPPLSRPPVPGIRGVPPIIQPVVRPVVPIVAPTEKPQTTVYVGKISPTVENEFMLSLLRLCGPVKSWKRAQDPSNGAPRGFGFCEFESAEGVLRALRLLSKFNVDGQELVLNVNQATKEYLERYVEKKTEREKLKESENDGIEKDEETAPGVERKEPPKPPVLDSKKEENETSNKENQDSQNFGIVNDEDREADQDALEKLRNMVEERLKNNPLPPPPTQPPADGSLKANSEVPTKSRDGAESDVDIMRSDAADGKNDDETSSENKAASEHEKPDTSSPDRNKRNDRKTRDRDLKREKERELERYERERERERVRREREREMKIREAERLYKERLKEWESRERDKEHQRQHEREREKDKERERRREIMDQEDESDDESTRKRRRRSSMLEEKRKKRQREKDEDIDDRLREEEEVAAAKKRAIEEEEKQKQKQKDEPMQVPDHMINGVEEAMMVEESIVEEGKSQATEQLNDETLINTIAGEALAKSDISDGSFDLKQSSNAPTRKLGFGLVGSGKRTAVLSVFNEEDEDDAEKEKKMRPLVPIDYSTEELQAVQPPVSGATPPNLVAAAEFAKRISNVNQKEERSEGERERIRRSNDRSTLRERDRNDEESTRGRDENKEKTLERERDREHSRDKLKTPDNKKLLDAKQLIDMIPKTKEELFSYEINWAVYDKHELHERMRPWISKKITEFLGEEEATLVDYIVSSTKEHVRASQMLEQLQVILDDEAEMFVLKMWRMLIFEIKKVETGLSLKPKA